MRLWRRAAALGSLAAALLAGSLAFAGGADAAGVVGHRSGAAPQAWIIVAGLATVPIALVALAAMLRAGARDKPDDKQQNPCRDEPCSRV